MQWTIATEAFTARIPRPSRPIRDRETDRVVGHTQERKVGIPVRRVWLLVPGATLDGPDDETVDARRLRMAALLTAGCIKFGLTWQGGSVRVSDSRQASNFALLLKGYSLVEFARELARMVGADNAESAITEVLEA